MNIKHISILVLLLASVTLFAVPVTATRKVVSETIEAAAKKSGKALTPALKKSSEKLLRQAMKQYGDDIVLKAVQKGGLEALEQGGKHGKVFWNLCAHTPQAARSLALHADDLLPIAKRIGPEFMKLETHVPGLGKKAVTCFGDDSVRLLSKMPADDAAKMIKLGMKADSPKTAKLLLEGCEKTSGTILKHLDSKKIIASGLSASMVIGAWKVSDGIEEGLETVASKSPEHFTRVLSYPMFLAVVCGFLIIAWLAFPLRKWIAAKYAVKKP